MIGTGINGDLALNGGFRTNSFPQAAVNPVSGNVYVVYNDRTAGVDKADVFLRQSTDGGLTWGAQVRVNDVLNATQYWVDKAVFEANFADFNNMAVIFQ